MDNGIIITTFLQGKIGGSVRHTETQTIRFDNSEVGASKPMWINRKIIHNDRPEQKCYKKLKISSELVADWVSSNVPFWSNKKEWSRMNTTQRLSSYVSRFDEGFGVNYEEI